MMMVPSCANEDVLMSVRRLTSNDTKVNPYSQIAQSFKESLPRILLNGEHVSSEFYPADSGYRESLFMLGGLGLLFAVLAFIWGAVFCSARYIFDRCGGKQPRLQGYTKLERSWVSVSLLICVAAVVTCVIFGWVGNNHFNARMEKTGEALVSTSESVQTNLQTLVASLKELHDKSEFTSEPTTLFSNDTANAALAVTTAKNAKAEIRSQDRTRSILLIVGYVLVMLTMAVCFYALFFDKGTFALIGGLSGFVCLNVLFLLAGYHLSISVLIMDMCVSMKTFTSNVHANATFVRDAPSYTKGISVLCPCASNQTFVNQDAAVRTARAQQLAHTNHRLESYGQYVTVDNVTLIVNDTMYDATTRQDATDVVTFSTALALMSDLSTCATVADGLPTADVCGQIQDSADMMMGTQFIGALLLIPTVVLAILGSKRFNKSYHIETMNNYLLGNNFRRSSQMQLSQYYDTRNNRINSH
eukprot:GILJ01010078.1.p1 GENE.GILJ01010078.1~~GILJ01010078.1.p1  ORF type:complete len:505 (-),score=71.57 GILJ01010078.1:91-1509(-)